jgi:TonB family protein
MALREKLGRLVLLEETEVSVLGREYRAARLGPTGLDRLVTVLCFAPGVSSQAAVTKRLMDEARLAARLQNPGLVRVLGIGRVEQTFYISTELVEGRTLSAIFERCQRESFPFAADHALMVASRVASALEYLHGKKDDSGTKLFHGLLTPSRIVVSYDGEVKLKGLGLWTALREAELLEPAERLYLAPEQAGGAGDPRSDVYALGLIMLHALTGSAPDGGDPRMALAEAKVVNVSGEAAPVPKLLAETLGRALAEDPAARYASMADMRKAIDTLLFSGDFTPTTFDLAFFMHTLFRDDMDHESRAIDEARRADYREFLEAEAPKSGSSPTLSSGEVAVPRPVTPPPESATTRPLTGEVAVVSPKLEPTPPRPTSSPALPLIPPPEPVAPRPVLEPIAASVTPQVPEPPAISEPPLRTFGEPSHSGSGSFADVKPVEHRVEHHASRESGSRSARETSGRDASMRLTLGASAPQPAGRNKLWFGIAGAVVLIGVGVGAWMFLSRPAPAPTPPPLTPEAAAAMARVKELEQRIAAIDKQRADAEAAAAAEVEKKLKAEAEKKGRAVDAAAVAKAQEEARQKARAEQEARQQQEMRRLGEAKKAEEARLAAEMKAAAESTPLPAPPTTVAVAPPTTAAAAAGGPETQPSPSNAPVQPGALVAITDPKLVPPLQLSGNSPIFPPLAAQQRIEGSVDLSALIDENGRVAEVTVLRAKPKNVGFEAAATQSVRSRRYRPGTKDGVPVKVWVTIAVQFKRSR